MPSGISCVRHGASRPSRSTIRSTASFAIRRHVVSLPPVIVTIPLERLVQLGLARDVDRLLRVAGRDQRPHAGVRAGDVAGAERPSRRTRCSASSRYSTSSSAGRTWSSVALVVVVGRADERLAEPRQHEDRAPAARRHDRAGVARGSRSAGSTMCVPRLGRMHRHLGLVVQLVRAQPVGPHAGRVDDVRRRGPRTRRRSRASRTRTPRRAVALEQPVTSTRLAEHRAEALGLAEHGQHEPHVVGLAVVEQVAAASGARPASAGSSSTTSSPSITRWRVGAPVLAAVEVGVARRAGASGERRSVDRHHVVHVQPDADAAGPGRAPSNAGHDQRQRPHQVRRERRPSAGARAAPRARARGRSSAGSAGRRGRACSSATRCRRRSRAFSTSATE